MIVTEIGDLMGGLKKLLVNFMVKKVKKMVPSYRLPQAISFSDALQRGKAGVFKPVAVKKSDIAFLQYTGGTTGLSKGAELTHANVMANLYQVEPLLKNTAKGPLVAGDIAVIPLPLYHIYALGAIIIMLNNGLVNLLVTNPRDFQGFIKILKKPFHTTIGVNTLYNALLNQPNFSEVNISAVKGCSAGGMALQEAVFKNGWKGRGSRSAKAMV